MKPLLRVVLIVDALLLLAFGLLFLLTPWTSLYNALQLVQTEPALVGQGFGVALIGLAWLALHASFDGALTSAVAKVVGHVNWLTGVLMLVWLLGLRTPSLTGFGQVAAVLAGVVLVVVGLAACACRARCGGVRRASWLKALPLVLKSGPRNRLNSGCNQAAKTLKSRPKRMPRSGASWSAKLRVSRLASQRGFRCITPSRWSSL